MNVFMVVSHWPLASDGDGGGIFWLIVTVIVVISQILKANKAKKTGPSASEPGGHPGENNPTEDLQRFLESLGGNVKPKPPARPKSQPPPLRQAVHGTGQTGTGRRSVAGTAAYAKARPTATPAKAGLVAKLSSKRVAVSPSAPPPPSDVHDVWVKPARAAFRHFQHSEDFGVKADARKEGLQQLRKGIGDDLVGKAHLRKAMVLKEILGPPLALRNPAAAS